jgi:CrcB protein
MIGALLRYLVSGWMSRAFGSDFPYGTLAVNLLGCLLIGLIAGLGAGKGLRLNSNLQMFLVIGFLGAFTTFSTFGYDSWKLMQESEFLKLFLNIASNVILGFLAVWAGVLLGKTY